MCTCVTPNEIFPYLFFCRAMLSPTINFVPIKRSEKHVNMDDISKKLNIIHLKSKCICVRV
jgi:hypothetical protein